MQYDYGFCYLIGDEARNGVGSLQYQVDLSTIDKMSYSCLCFGLPVYPL